MWRQHHIIKFRDKQHNRSANIGYSQPAHNMRSILIPLAPRSRRDGSHEIQYWRR